THEALTVLLRAERRYGAVWLAVSLNAFEDRLAIMQHCRCWIHGKSFIWATLCIMPALFLSPVDGDHMVSEILAESWVGQNLGQAFFRCGMRGRFYGICKRSHGL